MKERQAAQREYFLKLARYGTGLLDKLPIEREPQPLEYALGKLAPLLDELRVAEIAAIADLQKPAVPSDEPSELGVGLNSIGMLADRFTILIIKEWCLRNKGARDARKAAALFEGQTLDIIEALSLARPGSSAMNSKITTIKGDARALNWVEAFFGLLTTNLLMWESQEMLYIKNIADEPIDELRAYIKWFSYSNIRRNEYIAYCEHYFWK